MLLYYGNDNNGILLLHPRTLPVNLSLLELLNNYENNNSQAMKEYRKRYRKNVFGVWMRERAGWMYRSV